MQQNNSKENHTERLIPVTVRFSEGAMSVINLLAENNRMTKAEVVRLAVDNRLEEYLQKTLFFDAADAKNVTSMMYELLTEIQKIRSEIHRLGVNYNQELKMKNIENKYSMLSRRGVGLTYNQIKEKTKEVDAVKNDVQNFTHEELEAILTRYEAATEKVRDLLCLILE